MMQYRHIKLDNLLVLMYLWIIDILQAHAMINHEAEPEPSCTRSCTMLDDKTDCWVQSIDYFTNQVQISLRDYAAVMTHMNRWRANLPAEGRNEIQEELKTFEESSLNRTLNRFSEWNAEEQAPLNNEDLREIFNILLTRTKEHMGTYADPAVIPPPVSCPVDCDYYPHVWSILSYTLIACLVLCCLVFFLHTCYKSRRLDNISYQHKV